MDIFSTYRRIPILLLAAIVFTLFLQLGGRGLNEPDEGRYSEMGREMHVTGDWLVPRLNGVPHYAKPPWIYWSIAISLKIFGIHEWSARLPSALAATITALTAFAIGRRMGGERAGWIAALTLVSSLLFFMIARLITPDMMLTSLTTLALYCFWRWWISPSCAGRWLFGMYVFLGIAFLDKGLVPIGICFLTIFGFLLLQRKAREIPKLCLVRGLLLVALIALPWFLVLCKLNPDLFDFYLVGEVKDRIMSGRGRTRDWWYHLLWLPGDCWPWTILAGCAIWTNIRWWREKKHLAESAAFLLAWFLFPLVMFSASSSKLPTYILPLMVPLHLMLGLWLARVWEGKEPLPTWVRWFTCILLPAPTAGILWYFQFRTMQLSSSTWEKAWLMAKMILAVIALGLLIGIFASWLWRRKGLPAFLWLCGGISFLTFHGAIFSMHVFETRLGHNSSWRSISRELEGRDLVGIPISLDLHPSGKKPVFAHPGPRVLMYEFYDRSASFYLMRNRAEIVPLYAGNSLWEITRDINAEAKPNRDDLITLLKGPETVYVFTRPHHHTELRTLTGMPLPLIKSAGGDKDEKRVVLFSNQR